MTKEQEIKKLKERLHRAGDKCKHLEREKIELEQEIDILKYTIHSEPMYDEGVDYLIRQNKEFMDNMKSFRFWLKYRIQQSKIKLKKK